VDQFGEDLRPEDTGARLRAVRELAGLSSRDIARAAGISKRELAAAERGKQRLTQEQLRALAGALGIEPEVLVSAGLGQLDQQASESDRIDAFVGHDPDGWDALPASPSALPPALPVDLPNPERRRDPMSRKRVEDSWTDVRSEMDGVIRQCMKVSTIGSGDDIREMLDMLEIEVRRLKTSHTFLRAVARHERLITQVRGGTRNKPSPVSHSRAY
jgi:transcriptional regulator with XRE-family HTH domain